MYSSFSNSYDEKNENLFDFNNLNINQNNRSIKPTFTNLRYYDNNNDFFNENINPFNENKNKSTIVAKKSNYRIQKDRFQKFVLNNSSSASTINPNKIVLQPLTTSFKKTNINSTLRQKFLSNYNDYVFNAGKSEGNLL